MSLSGVGKQKVRGERSPRIHHPIRIYRIVWHWSTSALPVGPIDKGDKYTHRALRHGRRRTTSNDGRFSSVVCAFHLRVRINQRRDKLRYRMPNVTRLIRK